MDWLLETFRLIHVIAGTIGLAVFWIPIFSRKGARQHVRFGRIFVRAAYVVLAAAVLALVVRLVELDQRGMSVDDAPQVYALIVFLGYLSFVTWVIIRHGMAVLRHKNASQALRTPSHILLAWGAIAASLLLIAYAYYFSPPMTLLLYALSPVGIATGVGNLRYIRSTPTSARAWWYEHLGAMLGAGVAFHTAFAVFGVTRLFDIGLTGWVAAIPWIAPTAIGIPAITIWTRHYRRKFGEIA